MLISHYLDYCLTMSEVQPDHGHDEGLSSEYPVLGKAQHQALQHLVAHSHPSLPQGAPQGIGGGLAAPCTLVILGEGSLQVVK